MADQQKKTRLIVREIREIHRGTTSANVDYVMYQVVATRPDGTNIDQNLRTFEELPTNEVIEVAVTKYDSPQYGVSYTLKQVGRQSSRDLIKALADRVARLEQAVYQGAQNATPEPVLALAPPPVPPAPPPAAPSAQRQLPADDSIPF